MSVHGDLAINDYMCATLATAPTQLSPIKFHNSVHNAAVGYWTIGTGCQQASNSLSAFEYTFAAALLEAAAQCAADAQPLLLVGFDAEAVGPLRQVHVSEGLLAGGFVLAPERTERTVAALDWTLVHGPSERAALQSPVAKALPPNAISDLLPLFEALATLGADTRRCACRCRRSWRSNSDSEPRGPGPMTAAAPRSSRRDHHGRRPRRPHARVAAHAQRLEGIDVLVLERRAHPVPHAAHKVGESSVEIGAHYTTRCWA